MKRKEAFARTRGAEERVNKILQSIHANVPLLLEGPTGTSKTRSAIEACSRLQEENSQEIIRFNFSAQTTIEDLFGRICSDQESLHGFEYKYGEYSRAFKDGHFLILDEINLASESVLQCIEASLDSGYLSVDLPGNPQEIIKCHNNFRIIATQNPINMEFAQKRQNLSDKFLSHFHVVTFGALEQDDLLDIARELVKTYQVECSEKVVENIINFHVKWQKEEDDKRIVFTIREISSTLLSIANGMNILDAILLHYGARYSNEKIESMKNILLNMGFQTSDEQNIEIPENLFYQTEIMKDVFTKSSQLLDISLPVLLVGDYGCGKTHAAQWISKHFSEKHSNEYMIFICNPETTVSDILGRFVPIPDPNNKDIPIVEWVNGPVIKCLLEGKCLILDQIDMAPSTVSERLNSLFDDRTHDFDLPENPSCKSIKIHPDFRIVGTCTENGIQNMSPSFINRFSIIHMGNQLLQMNDLEIESFIIFLTQERTFYKNFTSLKNNCTNISQLVRIIKGFQKLKQKFPSAKEEEIYLFCKTAITGKDPPAIPSDFKNLLLNEVLNTNRNENDDDLDKYYIQGSTTNVIATLITCSIIGLHVVLVGETGIGKTASATEFASRNLTTQQKYQLVPFNSETQLEQLFGHIMIDQGNFVHKLGNLAECMKEGHVFIADELNLAEPQIIQSLSIAIEAIPGTNKVILPGSGNAIETSPNFLFIGCQNDITMHGRKQLPESFKRKVLMFPYPELKKRDFEEICRSISKEYKVSEDISSKIYDIRQRMRENSIFRYRYWSLREVRKLYRRIKYTKDNQSYIGIYSYHHAAYMLLMSLERKKINITIIASLISEIFKINKADLEKSLSDDVIVDVEKKHLSRGNITIVQDSFPNVKSNIHSFWNSYFEVLLTHPSEPLLFVGPTGYKTFLAEMLFHKRNAKLVHLHNDITTSSLIGQTILYEKYQIRNLLIESLKLLVSNYPRLFDAFEVFQTRMRSLGFDEHDLQQLIETIEENPEIKKSDFLPIVHHIVKKILKTENSDSSSGVLSKYSSEFSLGIITKAIFEQSPIILKNISRPSVSVLERLNELLSIKPSLTLSEDICHTFTEENKKRISNFSNEFRLIGICRTDERQGLSEAMLSRLSEIRISKYSKKEQDEISNDIFESIKSTNSKIQYMEDFNNIINKITKKVENEMNYSILFGKQLQVIQIVKKLVKVQDTNLELYLMPIIRCLGGIMNPDHRNTLISTIKELYPTKSKDTISIYDIYSAESKEINTLVIDNEQGNLDKKVKSIPSGFYVKTNYIEEHQTEKIYFNCIINDILDLLIMAKSINYPVILEGSNGIGKSTAFNYLAHTLGKDDNVVRITLSSITTIEDLFGKVELDPDQQKFEFVPTDFLNAITNKGKYTNTEPWILIEELNLASFAVLDSLRPIFDTSEDEKHQRIILPDGSFGVKGNYFLVCLASSPINHSSTKDSTIYYKISSYNDYPDEFKRICNSMLETIGDEERTDFVNKICKAQKYIVKYNSKIPITPRDVTKYLKLRNDSSDNQKLMESLIINRFSSIEEIKAISEKMSFTDSKNIPTINIDGNTMIVDSIPVTIDSRQSKRINEINTLTLSEKNLFVFLASAIITYMPILIQGPTASGKSYATELFARIIGKKYHIIQVNSETSSSSLTGKFQAKGLEEADFSYLQERIVQLHKEDFVDIEFEKPIREWASSKFHYFLSCLKEIQVIGGQDLDIIDDIVDFLDNKLSFFNGFSRTDSIFVEAMENGNWIILDGIESAPSDLFNRLLTLLDDDPYLNLYELGPGHTYSMNLKSDKRIHPDFRLIMTYNPTTLISNRLPTSFLTRCTMFTTSPIDNTIIDSSLVFSSISNHFTQIHDIINTVNWHISACNYHKSHQITGRSLIYLAKSLRNATIFEDKKECVNMFRLHYSNLLDEDENIIQEIITKQVDDATKKQTIMEIKRLLVKSQGIGPVLSYMNNLMEGIIDKSKYKAPNPLEFYQLLTKVSLNDLPKVDEEFLKIQNCSIKFLLKSFPAEKLDILKCSKITTLQIFSILIRNYMYANSLTPLAYHIESDNINNYSSFKGAVFMKKSIEYLLREDLFPITLPSIMMVENWTKMYDINDDSSIWEIAEILFENNIPISVFKNPHPLLIAISKLKRQQFVIEFDQYNSINKRFISFIRGKTHKNIKRIVSSYDKNRIDYESKGSNVFSINNIINMLDAMINKNEVIPSPLGEENEITVDISTNVDYFLHILPNKPKPLQLILGCAYFGGQGINFFSGFMKNIYQETLTIIDDCNIENFINWTEWLKSLFSFVPNEWIDDHNVIIDKIDQKNINKVNEMRNKYLQIKSILTKNDIFKDFIGKITKKVDILMEQSSQPQNVNEEMQLYSKFNHMCYVLLKKIENNPIIQKSLQELLDILNSRQNSLDLKFLERIQEIMENIHIDNQSVSKFAWPMLLDKGSDIPHIAQAMNLFIEFSHNTNLLQKMNEEQSWNSITRMSNACNLEVLRMIELEYIENYKVSEESIDGLRTILRTNLLFKLNSLNSDFDSIGIIKYINNFINSLRDSSYVPPDGMEPWAQHISNSYSSDLILEFPMFSMDDLRSLYVIKLQNKLLKGPLITTIGIDDSELLQYIDVPYPNKQSIIESIQKYISEKLGKTYEAEDINEYIDLVTNDPTNSESIKGLVKSLFAFENISSFFEPNVRIDLSFDDVDAFESNDIINRFPAIGYYFTMFHDVRPYIISNIKNWGKRPDSIPLCLICLRLFARTSKIIFKAPINFEHLSFLEKMNIKIQEVIPELKRFSTIMPFLQLTSSSENYIEKAEILRNIIIQLFETPDTETIHFLIEEYLINNITKFLISIDRNNKDVDDFIINPWKAMTKEIENVYIGNSLQSISTKNNIIESVKRYLYHIDKWVNECTSESFILKFSDAIDSDEEEISQKIGEKQQRLLEESHDPEWEKVSRKWKRYNGMINKRLESLPLLTDLKSNSCLTYNSYYEHLLKHIDDQKDGKAPLSATPTKLLLIQKDTNENVKISIKLKTTSAENEKTYIFPDIELKAGNIFITKMPSESSIESTDLELTFKKELVRYKYVRLYHDRRVEPLKDVSKCKFDSPDGINFQYKDFCKEFDHYNSEQEKKPKSQQNLPQIRMSLVFDGISKEEYINLLNELNTEWNDFYHKFQGDNIPISEFPRIDDFKSKIKTLTSFSEPHFQIDQAALHTHVLFNEQKDKLIAIQNSISNWRQEIDYEKIRLVLSLLNKESQFSKVKSHAYKFSISVPSNFESKHPTIVTKTHYDTKKLLSLAISRSNTGNIAINTDNIVLTFGPVIHQIQKTPIRIRIVKQIEEEVTCSIKTNETYLPLILTEETRGCLYIVLDIESITFEMIKNYKVVYTGNISFSIKSGEKCICPFSFTILFNDLELYIESMYPECFPLVLDDDNKAKILSNYSISMEPVGIKINSNLIDDIRNSQSILYEKDENQAIKPYSITGNHKKFGFTFNSSEKEKCQQFSASLKYYLAPTTHFDVGINSKIINKSLLVGLLDQKRMNLVKDSIFYMSRSIFKIYVFVGFICSRFGVEKVSINPYIDEGAEYFESLEPIENENIIYQSTNSKTSQYIYQICFKPRYLSQKYDNFKMGRGRIEVSIGNKKEILSFEMKYHVEFFNQQGTLNRYIRTISIWDDDKFVPLKNFGLLGKDSILVTPWNYIMYSYPPRIVFSRKDIDEVPYIEWADNSKIQVYCISKVNDNGYPKYEIINNDLYSMRTEEFKPFFDIKNPYKINQVLVPILILVETNEGFDWIPFPCYFGDSKNLNNTVNPIDGIREFIHSCIPTWEGYIDEYFMTKLNSYNNNIANIVKLLYDMIHSSDYYFKDVMCKLFDIMSLDKNVLLTNISIDLKLLNTIRLLNDLFSKKINKIRQQNNHIYFPIDFQIIINEQNMMQQKLGYSVNTIKKNIMEWNDNCLTIMKEVSNKNNESKTQTQIIKWSPNTGFNKSSDDEKNNSIKRKKMILNNNIHYCMDNIMKKDFTLPEKYLENDVNEIILYLNALTESCYSFPISIYQNIENNESIEKYVQIFTGIDKLYEYWKTIYTFSSFKLLLERFFVSFETLCHQLKEANIIIKENTEQKRFGFITNSIQPIFVIPETREWVCRGRNIVSNQKRAKKQMVAKHIERRTFIERTNLSDKKNKTYKNLIKQQFLMQDEEANQKNPKYVSQEKIEDIPQIDLIEHTLNQIQTHAKYDFTFQPNISSLPDGYKNINKSIKFTIEHFVCASEYLTNEIQSKVLEQSKILSLANSTYASILIDCTKKISPKNRANLVILAISFANTLNLLNIPYTIHIFGEKNLISAAKLLDEPHDSICFQRMFEELTVVRNQSDMADAILQVKNLVNCDGRDYHSLFVLTDGMTPSILYPEEWKRRILNDPKTSISFYFTDLPPKQWNIMKGFTESFRDGIKNSNTKTYVSTFESDKVFDDDITPIYDLFVEAMIQLDYKEKESVFYSPIKIESTNAPSTLSFLNNQPPWMKDDLRFVQTNGYIKTFEKEINMNDTSIIDQFMISLNNESETTKLSEILEETRKLFDTKSFDEMTQFVFPPNLPSQLAPSENGRGNIYFPGLIRFIITKGQENKIFLEKIAGLIRDYNVIIVFDCSQSSLSSPHSFETLLSLLSTLSKLDLPSVSIILSGENSPQVICNGQPTFTCLSQSSTLWLSLFGAIKPHLGTTFDSAIKAAASFQSYQSHKRSIIFALTDCNYSSSIRKNIATICDSIDAIAIGIGVGSYPIHIKKTFRKCVYARNPKDLINLISCCCGKDGTNLSPKIVIPKLKKVNNSVIDDLSKMFLTSDYVFSDLIDSIKKIRVKIDYSYYFNTRKVSKEMFTAGKNEIGREFDLVYGRKFKNQRILICQFWDKCIAEDEHKDITRATLEKGLVKELLSFIGEVKIVQDYYEAINQIKTGKYAQVWIICSKHIDVFPNRKENEKVKNLKGETVRNIELDNDFINYVFEFWRLGGGLVWWADGHIAYQLNQFLERANFRFSFEINKCDPGGNEVFMVPGDLNSGENGLFEQECELEETYDDQPVDRSLFSFNIVKIAEGKTISYVDDINKLYPFRPFARSKKGNIVAVYYTDEKYGDIIIDGGFTKLFHDLKITESDATLRYVRNIAAWMLQIEKHEAIYRGSINCANWHPKEIRKVRAVETSHKEIDFQPRNIDIAFMIDVTGSMNNNVEGKQSTLLDAINNQITSIIAYLDNFKHYHIRFGAVCYRDPAFSAKYTDKMDEEAEVKQFKTRENVKKFIQEMERVKAGGGGGDGPEDWVDAFTALQKLKWRNGARLCFHLTDRPGHLSKISDGRDGKYARFNKEEEEKLIPLVEDAGEKGIVFYNIASDEYAKRGFDRIRYYYESGYENCKNKLKIKNPFSTIVSPPSYGFDSSKNIQDMIQEVVQQAIDIYVANYEKPESNQELEQVQEIKPVVQRENPTVIIRNAFTEANIDISSINLAPIRKIVQGCENSCDKSKINNILKNRIKIARFEIREKIMEAIKNEDETYNYSKLEQIIKSPTHDDNFEETVPEPEPVLQNQVPIENIQPYVFAEEEDNDENTNGVPRDIYRIFRKYKKISIESIRKKAGGNLDKCSDKNFNNVLKLIKLSKNDEATIRSHYQNGDKTYNAAQLITDYGNCYR